MKNDKQPAEQANENSEFLKGLNDIFALFKLLKLDADAWPSDGKCKEIASKLKSYYFSENAEIFAQKVLSVMTEEEIEELAA